MYLLLILYFEAAVWLRPLACWDCGFESRRELGCLSLVFVTYCASRGFFDGPILRPEES